MDNQGPLADLFRIMGQHFRLGPVGKMPEGMLAEGLLEGDALFSDFFRDPEIKGLRAKLVGKKAELGEMEKGYEEVYQLAQNLVEQAREREAQLRVSLDKSEDIVERLEEKCRGLQEKVEHLEELLCDTGQAREDLSERLKSTEASLVEKDNVLKSILAICQALIKDEEDGKHRAKGEFVEAMRDIIKMIPWDSGNDAGEDGRVIIPVVDARSKAEASEAGGPAAEIGGASMM